MMTRTERSKENLIGNNDDGNLSPRSFNTTRSCIEKVLPALFLAAGCRSVIYTHSEVIMRSPRSLSAITSADAIQGVEYTYTQTMPKSK